MPLRVEKFILIAIGTSAMHVNAILVIHTNIFPLRSAHCVAVKMFQTLSWMMKAVKYTWVKINANALIVNLCKPTNQVSLAKSKFVHNAEVL